MKPDQHESLSAETSYLFRHALFRDAVYTLLLPSDRSRLHQLAADLLEGILGKSGLDGEWLLEVANQLALAQVGASSVSPRRADITRRAAKWAENSYLLQQAKHLWHGVLACCAPTERPSALVDLGSCLYRLGELPAAETTLRDALKTCTAEVDHIDGCLALGSVLKDRGQFAESCKVLEHGLALSRHLQDQMRTAQTLGNLALSLFLAGKSAEAVEAHRNALKLFTLAGNRKGLAKECVNFGGTLSACNLGAEAEQVIRTALNEARDLGLPHLEALAECNLAFLYEVSGRGEEFPGLTDSAVGKARACGDWNALATALNARASRLGNSGRLAEAESEFLELLEMVLETGNVVFEVSARGNLGVVYHRSGKLKAAESELVRAVELASTHNDSRTESYFSCQLALLYVSTGRREAAAALWRAHAANVAATLPAPFVAELEREMVQVCTCAGIPRLE